MKPYRYNVALVYIYRPDMKVAVIGGGLVGLFTSYYLLKKGVEVVIYDVEPRGGRASENNAGLITPSFSATPRISMFTLAKAGLGLGGFIRVSLLEVLRKPGWFFRIIRSYGRGDDVVRYLALESLKLYLDFFEMEDIDVDLVRGVIAVFKDMKDAEELSRIAGGRVLDGKELSEMGYIGMGGGVYVEHEISINPLKLYRGLRRRVEELGGRIIVEDVLGVEEEGREPKAILGSGKRGCDGVVIAAGSRSGDLCRSISYDPHVFPARGIVALYDTAGEKVVLAPALLEDYGIGVAQHGSDTLRITGFFEIIGHRVDGVQEDLEELISTAKKHVRGLGSLKLRAFGMGFRPCTADLLPLIGRIPGTMNIYIATGLCRLGVTMSPIAGIIIASMILDLEPPVKPVILDAVSPSRFIHRP